MLTKSKGNFALTNGKAEKISILLGHSGKLALKKPYPASNPANVNASDKMKIHQVHFSIF
ncbi:hypothetical protein JGI12_01808 [Candidatus Kryptonium thompsonii]|nr:hypothetical protein JGI12_01808 [Candidatus Kryptonium thompsoni]